MSVRALLLLLAALLALALAPSDTQRTVPVQPTPSRLKSLPLPPLSPLGRPDTRGDAQSYWREVAAPDRAGLQLSVTPKVGIAPLAVSITLRLPQPREDDRELELTVWDAGDEDMASPLFRSARDIYWREARLLRQALQIAPGQPDTFESVPQTLQAHWRLPAGQLMVVGCVWPRSACVAERVSVT